MIIAKSFMKGIPFELTEAAKVDGAGDFYIFWKIILPTAKPLIATIGLFTALTYWNDWYNCMLFMSTGGTWNLQYTLQNILNSSEALKRIAAMTGMQVGTKVQGETGVIALNTNANRNQTLEPYLQAKGYDYFTEGFDYFYNAENKEELPAWDSVIYLYTSDLYLEYAKEMAELAKAGVWSKDAINDTNDATAYFENGTSGCIGWNFSAIDAGKKMEKAGLGTFAVYDVSPDIHMARSRYNGDMIAIATNSKQPERAALVLDYMKSDVDLNRTMLGGIRGEHWDLNEEGADEPVRAGTDERRLAITESIDSRELFAEVAGFTFDSSSVATELSVVNSIVDEYEYSFSLGIYGDNTEAKFNEFKSKLEAAGLDKVTEAMKTQYEAFAAQ